ncbi:MAG: glycosyltransferase [Clostridiales bacterium]|nr:glycosyltransferase [Clostridiales bacterium]
MSISIVMTTYNGSEYIMRQLRSILNQSLKPDEVLIFDDRSSDNTVEIVESFIQKNGLNTWKVHINSQNLGWRKNFAQAINAASGDYIFLSDQDDEWKEDKVELLVGALSSKKDIELIVTNYLVEYVGNDNTLIKNSTKKIGNHILEKVSLKGSTYDVIRPGCTMAFKHNLVKYFNLVWNDIVAHDRVLWDVSLARNTAYIYNDALITQVRHANTNTPSNPRLLSGRVKMINNRKKVAVSLIENVSDIPQENIEWFNRYISVTDSRIKYMNASSIIGLIKLLPKVKYYPKFTSWLADIVCVVKGN